MLSPLTESATCHAIVGWNLWKKVDVARQYIQQAKGLIDKALWVSIHIYRI